MGVRTKAWRPGSGRARKPPLLSPRRAPTALESSRAARGTAGCVLTCLAPCALEPQHDGGSGLVPGPAASPAGEGGGDPLSQQVPPAAPASWEARQVRGPTEYLLC